MPHDLHPATRPTMYFIGVTTGQSSINRVFPRWAAELKLGDCELRGLDFPLHDRPENFRAAVDFIKRDPGSLGALVTTHKIDLFNACQDQFDVINPVARSLGEISSIYKRRGQLHGRTVDLVNSRHALEAFLPAGHWASGAEALILGAGGAGTALARHLCAGESEGPRPRCLHIAERDAVRLDQVWRRHAEWRSDVPLHTHLVATPAAADALVNALLARSLVVNATGLGKDAPGSPLTSAARFPERGFAWDFNYRGELEFLEQARAQQAARNLHVEDGWIYFLHGWSRVMADVFDREIPARGPVFDALGRIAAEER